MKLLELEKTYGKDKISSIEVSFFIQDIRSLELDINYDIEKLKELFLTIKDSLEGPLGS